MTAVIDYTCPDCGRSQASIAAGHFLVAHAPTCPALTNMHLNYLATCDVYDAAAILDEARGMVADYDSAPVIHAAA